MKPTAFLALLAGAAVYVFVLQPAPAPYPIPEPDENAPATVSLPGDCAIVATTAYGRVVRYAAWARLLHLNLNNHEGHMVCVWQINRNDPVLVYDVFLLGGSTLELQTARREVDVIVAALNDHLSRPNHGDVARVKIMNGYFVTSLK